MHIIPTIIKANDKNVFLPPKGPEVLNKRLLCPENAATS